MLTFKEDFWSTPISDAEGETQECKWKYWSQRQRSDIQSPVDSSMKDIENHILQAFLHSDE